MLEGEEKLKHNSCLRAKASRRQEQVEWEGLITEEMAGERLKFPTKLPSKYTEITAL